MIKKITKAHGVSIVIPAFNEERGIGPVLEQLSEVMQSTTIKYEVLVIDDGSTDNTAKVARGYPVTLIQHPVNRGYGAALKTGIRHARYDLICITDADGTYPPKYIPDLLSQMDTFDMVVGARTGKSVKVPLLRRPAKWVLNVLANYLTGIRIPDLNSGLRIFRKKVALEFLHVCPNGFSFTTTITLALLTNDYLVKFLPIDYQHRTGSSKIRPIRDTINFFNLIIRTVTYFAPLKVFIPLSMGLMVVGIALLIYRALVSTGLAVTIVVIFLAALQMIAFGLLADMITKLNPHRAIGTNDPDRGNDES